MKYNWIFDERIEALIFGDPNNGGVVVEALNTISSEVSYYGYVVSPFAITDSNTDIIEVGPFDNVVDAQEAVEKEYDRILMAERNYLQKLVDKLP
jgi:hypothetical protein